jgi:hypothetical protein
MSDQRWTVDLPIVGYVRVEEMPGETAEEAISYAMDLDRDRMPGRPDAWRPIRRVSVGEGADASILRAVATLDGGPPSPDPNPYS